MDATERADTDAIVALLHENLRFSMPPQPGSWVGREVVVAAWTEGGFGSAEFRDFRCTLTRANRQPAVACYLRRPGEAAYEALALDVLRIDNGVIIEITSFGPDVFPASGLPPAR
jgi:RNA polymerase sigma-70 factor (ECF subfamily)